MTLLLPASQGKRHQQNLAKRAAREAQDKPTAPAPQRRVALKKTVKIGRPGYRVTKQFDSDIKQRSLLFQVRNKDKRLPHSLGLSFHSQQQTSTSKFSRSHCSSEVLSHV